MSGLNTLIRLPAADSTNAWAKANLDRFGPVGAVYTTNQTAGRGRLGRAWANAAGQALYYTAVLRLPLADPGALPLYASLAVAAALRRQYGADCQARMGQEAEAILSYYFQNTSIENILEAE